MNDEIKEMLEYAKSRGYIDLDYEESKLLLDYITNLQQIEQDHQRINGELREENERLNAQIDAMSSLSKKDYKELFECLEDFEDGEEHFELPNTIQEIEDYKSRNEKAIEKIKKIQENAIKYGAYHDASICQDLLNILDGGDKDVKD